jgi:hypothetical protein
MKRLHVLVLGLGVAIATASGACGGDKPAPATAKVTPGGSKDPSQWPKDDRSLCDWKNKPELEVSETAGPGALRPNIRRVYKTFGEGDARHKTLICREIDTNLDGIKDSVRTFNAKGEPQHEEADRDYDGRIDVWMNFVDGRLSEEAEDTNGDGKPDLWKYYQNGQLYRIKRDRNHDGKPDVWEIYTKGRLERMGTDEDFDGHVDRWDRDEILRREADEAELKARAQMAAAQGDAGVSAPDLPQAGGGGKDAGAAKGAAPKKK